MLLFGSSREGLNLRLQTFCFECDSIRGDQTFQAFHNLLEKYVKEELVHEVVFEVEDTGSLYDSGSELTRSSR